MPLERVEPARPVGTIGLQPRVQFHQRLWAEPVQPPLRIAPDLHETSVAQHPQMARDTRLMHPDALDQVSDRALAIANGIEDAPPSRLGNHVQDGEGGGHLLNIRQTIYTCNRIYERKRDALTHVGPGRGGYGGARLTCASTRS